MRWIVSLLVLLGAGAGLWWWLGRTVCIDAYAEPARLGPNQVVGNESRDTADQVLYLIRSLREPVDQLARLLVMTNDDIRHVMLLGW